MEKFGQLINEKSGGSISIDIYPSGQLGGTTEFTEGVMSGSIDLGSGNPTDLVDFIPEMGLFDGNSGVLRSDAEGAIVYVRVYILYENGTKATPSTSDSLTISAQELFELN